MTNQGLVEGTLEQAIDFAIKQKDFFQWGAGGRIEKYKPPKIKKLFHAGA